MAATNRARKPPDGDAEADQPEILRLGTGNAVPGRRVVLFYIGEGDDEIAGSIPESPSAALGLEWLHKIATSSYQEAVDWGFETLLGPKAYAALRSCDDLTKESLAEITRKILTALREAGEGPKAR